MFFDAKYLIVGGGIAGTAAAETIRKAEPQAKIIVLSDEPHRLYSRVLLTKPNFFLEKIPFDRIYLKDDKWYQDLNIDLWLGRRAEHIDPSEKVVNLDNGEQIRYEKLLLAVGGSPRKLNVPGADKEGVHYLRTIDETKQIIEKVKHAKKGVAIGGGIIGFEMTEMMHLAGMEATFVIWKPHYRVNLLGEEASKEVERKICETGVRMLRDAETVEVLGDGHVTGVRFKDGRELECDFLVIGIGTVVPGKEMLEQAGVAVKSGIVANEYLETTVADIYTAGDCAEYEDAVIGGVLRRGDWANAQAQGQLAARNMMRNREREKYSYVSFFTTHGFGMAMTYVGDVRPDVNDRKVIERGDPKKPYYARIVIEGKRIVGAIFFDSSKSVSAVAKLITEKTDVSRKKAELADPNFDLSSLVKVKK